MASATATPAGMAAAADRAADFAINAMDASAARNGKLAGGSAAATPMSVASPMLKQQMAAWTRVIDQAEREIARKSSESQLLKNKLRQAEFEVANKSREVAVLEERLSHMQYALQQKEQDKQQLLMQSAAAGGVGQLPTPQSLAGNGGGGPTASTALQPANLSHLLAAAAEASDTEGLQELRVKCSRLQREVELKKEYLAEKESFWHEEMEKLESLIASRDEELRVLRSDVASLRVERGQDSVDSRSRDLNAVRTQQAKEIRMSELEIELRAEQNRTAKMQSDNASELVAVRHEMAVERSRTKMFINICMPTLEEYGLQVKADPAEVASSMVSLINEMKTRTQTVASVINSTPVKRSQTDGGGGGGRSSSAAATDGIVKTVKEKIEQLQHDRAAGSSSSSARQTADKEDDMDGAPRIDKLLINGSTQHGDLITAQGILQGASKCRFSWFRGTPASSPSSSSSSSPPGGAGGFVYAPIGGVKTLTYYTSADDAGCMLRVEAVPVKEKGVEGRVSTAEFGVMETPELVRVSVDTKLQALRAAGGKKKGRRDRVTFVGVSVHGEPATESGEEVEFSVEMDDADALSVVKNVNGRDETVETCVLRDWLVEAVPVSANAVVLMKDTDAASSSNGRNIIKVDMCSALDRDVLLLLVRELRRVPNASRRRRRRPRLRPRRRRSRRRRPRIIRRSRASTSSARRA